MEFVTKSGYSLFGIGDSKNEDGTEKKWKAMISRYGYQLTDDFDVLLAETVKTGFFVKGSFIEEATRNNNKILAYKSERSFSEAWGTLHHNSFDNDAESVVSGLYESFKKNVKHILPANLNGTVTLFRKLDEDEKASEIIDIYIKKSRSEKSLFNMEQPNFFGDVRDEELVKKFDEIYEDSVTKKQLVRYWSVLLVKMDEVKVVKSFLQIQPLMSFMKYLKMPREITYLRM